MYQLDQLPRRPFLGFELCARKNWDDEREGLDLLRVVPDGAAARAGVRPGDRLLAVNDHDVWDPRELAAYARTLLPGAPLRFVVQRENQLMALEGEAIALPVERLTHAEVHLGHITVLEERQRVILTTPAAGKPPYPTILHLQGLGTQSCELSADPDEPLRHLLEGFSAAGLATLRVERSGVGDSEGQPLQTSSLFDEVAAYRAALAFLENHPLVGRVFLFGQSIGGMIAPMLAGEDSRLAGIAVFGTSALRWVECIVQATRRQKTLAGMTGEDLDAYVADWSRMHHEVCRNGALPWQVFAKHPDLGWLEGSACHGEHMFGRHAAFFQQLERMNLAALWKTVRTKVLVVHGEYDWACAPQEGRDLAALVAPEQVRYVELSAVGHDMRRHANLEESYAHPRRGNWDERIVQTVVEWVRKIES